MIDYNNLSDYNLIDEGYYSKVFVFQGLLEEAY